MPNALCTTVRFFVDDFRRVYYSTRVIDILQTPEFSKWLHKLKDRAAKVRILERLERVRTGNIGDHKPLGGGLHEMRLTYGPGYRVYYAMDGQTVIVLLVGGNKSTQSKDIEKAREIWKELQS